MKVAIFGGSFNPPTKGHEAIARACLERPEFDQVWVMPSGDRLDKTYSVDDTHRLAMTALMSRRIHNPHLMLSRLELKLERPSKTIRTVEALRERYPEVDPTFVFGADSYWDMITSAWVKGTYLRRNLQMLIVPCANSPNPKADNVEILDIRPEFQNISSTEVRRRLSVGESIFQLVDPWVEAYIDEHALYLPKPISRSG